MIFHQMMVMRLPVDDAYVERVVDGVLLPALMTAASPAARDTADTTGDSR